MMKGKMDIRVRKKKVQQKWQFVFLTKRTPSKRDKVAIKDTIGHKMIPEGKKSLNDIERTQGVPEKIHNRG